MLVRMTLLSFLSERNSIYHVTNADADNIGLRPVIMVTYRQYRQKNIRGGSNDEDPAQECIRTRGRSECHADQVDQNLGKTRKYKPPANRPRQALGYVSGNL